MSWLPWNRQPAPLPTRLERARVNLTRADAGVDRAMEHESAAWTLLRGAMRDAASAAEIRLKAQQELAAAEAEQPAETASQEGV